MRKKSWEIFKRYKIGLLGTELKNRLKLIVIQLFKTRFCIVTLQGTEAFNLNIIKCVIYTKRHSHSLQEIQNIRYSPEADSSSNKQNKIGGISFMSLKTRKDC